MSGVWNTSGSPTVGVFTGPTSSSDGLSHSHRLAVVCSPTKLCVPWVTGGDPACLLCGVSLWRGEGIYHLLGLAPDKLGIQSVFIKYLADAQVTDLQANKILISPVTWNELANS